MSFPVRLEWSTASVGSSHAPTDAVDHSAPSAIRPESTYISGKVVQTNGATSYTSAPPSAPTASPPRSAKAAWRCIGPETPSWTGLPVLCVLKFGR